MDLFVYGTLTDPDRTRAVLGEDWSFGPAAVLDGLHRVDGEFPTLAPGGRTEGRILRTADVEPLDRYEGVDRGLYVRVSIPRDDRPGESVDAYVGHPGRLDAGADWPGGGPFVDRVRRYVRDHEVVVRGRRR